LEHKAESTQFSKIFQLFYDFKAESLVFGNFLLILDKKWKNNAESIDFWVFEKKIPKFNAESGNI
jgi:hypothetical protein